MCADSGSLQPAGQHRQRAKQTPDTQKPASPKLESELFLHGGFLLVLAPDDDDHNAQNRQNTGNNLYRLLVHLLQFSLWGAPESHRVSGRTENN
jgi:hypothetical protein